MGDRPLGQGQWGWIGVEWVSGAWVMEGAEFRSFLTNPSITFGMVQRHHVCALCKELITPMVQTDHRNCIHIMFSNDIGSTSLWPLHRG